MYEYQCNHPYKRPPPLLELVPATTIAQLPDKCFRGACKSGYAKQHRTTINHIKLKTNIHRFRLWLKKSSGVFVQKRGKLLTMNTCKFHFTILRKFEFNFDNRAQLYSMCINTVCTQVRCRFERLSLTAPTISKSL